jgi:hypothetical protein
MVVRHVDVPESFDTFSALCYEIPVEVRMPGTRLEPRWTCCKRRWLTLGSLELHGCWMIFESKLRVLDTSDRKTAISSPPIQPVGLRGDKDTRSPISSSGLAKLDYSRWEVSCSCTFVDIKVQSKILYNMP